MLEQRYSDNDASQRDIPSFIEPRPPLIQNPFMRPRPQKGTNLMELFEEDSEIEEPELVQVYLRLKPCNVPNTLYEVRSDRCLVTSLDTATAGHGRRTQHNVSKMYTFSKIFGPECNQKEIFEQVVKENLTKLPEGHNFTLLTYGASGSGKTYTLMGTVGSPGLVPRSLEYVFRLVDAAQQPAYKPTEGGADKLNYAEQDYELQWVKRLRHVSAPLRDKYRRMSAQLHSDLTASSIHLSNRERHYVWVSFVEIYNEAIYDLLAPPEKRAKLRIREDTSGNVYVKDATQAFVRSGEEAYDVMVAGKHNLVVAATGVHAQSSRSHCIFTITMLTEAGEGGVRTSCVRLCDLAGCERARATKNTGARMQESRAINSSLHVLERCLHMLRRKQKTRNDALVPYRESKLTRLLGSGLSGARGEAVSMVVTLNPAPQYAHETKHVLSLAAVAQDIQINNTMLTTTLESSIQETTIACSDEVMKLRSDNERLHFELVHTQARNKELMAAMEERQQETANTMRELVEEAKDMTRQYYEAQLQALRCEMDDMIEEYEARLSKMPKEAPSSGAGTPSRYLQAKVAQLMTEIAVLEEQLTAERLARARAEKEVQHLRTCIEERDEKAFRDATPPQDVILSDSENQSDDDISDPLNESLEPVFKKDINRSRAKNDTVSEYTIDNIDEDDDFEENKSIVTLKDDDSIISTNMEEKAISGINKIDDKVNDISNSEDTIQVPNNMTSENTEIDSANCSYQNQDSFKHETTYEKEDNVIIDTLNLAHEKANNLNVENDSKNESIKSRFVCRGTYFVSDSKLNDIDDINFNSKDTTKNSSLRGTYFVGPAPETTKPIKDANDEIFKEPVIQKTTSKVSEKVNKIIKSFKTSQGSDSSLRHFEELEMATKHCDDETVHNQSLFGNSKSLKEKRNYFDNEPTKTTKEMTDEPIVNKEKRIYFDNLDVNVETNDKKINDLKNIDDERSLSIIKDVVVSEDFDSSKIKILFGESFTKPEIVTSVKKNRLAKKQASVDIFESPLVIPTNNVEIAQQSIEQLVSDQESTKKGDIREQKSPLKENVRKLPLEDNLHKSPMEETSKGDYTIYAKSSLKENVIISSLKEEVIKSLVTENIKSSVKENIIPLPVKENVIKPAIKEVAFKSPMKENIIQSPLKIDIILSTVKTDTLPSKIDILLSPLEQNVIGSPTKIDKVQTAKKVDTIPLSTNKDWSAVHKVTTQLAAKIDSIVKKNISQSPSKQTTGLSPFKKNTVPFQVKKDTIQSLIKTYDGQSTKDAAQLSTKIDTVLSYMKKDTDNLKKENKLEPMSTVEDVDIKKEAKLEPASSVEESNLNNITNNTARDNTIDEFENIYKDITVPRVTEFELLVSSSINETADNSDKAKEETKYNLRKKRSFGVGCKAKTDKATEKPTKSAEIADEVLLESHAKCESRARKRPLRLRRRRNQTEGEDSEDKLKDIVNLQSEFSDVTMDVPAPHKVVKDIPSPEKGAEENLPPVLGIQSCPAKSVTRSRRKLFTPRAEPLEESLTQTGDSNERIYVPRPSYHRPRARRKL